MIFIAVSNCKLEEMKVSFALATLADCFPLHFLKAPNSQRAAVDFNSYALMLPLH